MFDEMIIREGTVRNLTGADGEVRGFAFDSRIPYYRGLGLSMVETPELSVDGTPVDAEALRLTYRGVERTFTELADVTDVRWELGEDATISVLTPGGLTPGEHTLAINVRLRVSYLPFISENRYTRTVTID